jgi:hypothetical protein
LVESKEEVLKFSTSLNVIPKIAVFNSSSTFQEEEEEEEEDLFDKLRRKWSSEDKLPEQDEEESSVKHRLSVVDSSSSTNDEEEEEEMGERERFQLRRNRSLSFGRNREVRKRPGKIGALPIPNLRLETISHSDSSPESPCDGLISPGVFASPRPNEIFGSSEYSLQLPKEDGGSIQDCNCISSKTVKKKKFLIEDE